MKYLLVIIFLLFFSAAVGFAHENQYNRNRHIIYTDYDNIIIYKRPIRQYILMNNKIIAKKKLNIKRIYI